MGKREEIAVGKRVAMLADCVLLMAHGFCAVVSGGLAMVYMWVLAATVLWWLSLGVWGIVVCVWLYAIGVLHLFSVRDAAIRMDTVWAIVLPQMGRTDSHKRLSVCNRFGSISVVLGSLVAGPLFINNEKLSEVISIIATAISEWIIPELRIAGATFCVAIAAILSWELVTYVIRRYYTRRGMVH